MLVVGTGLVYFRARGDIDVILGEAVAPEC